MTTTDPGREPIGARMIRDADTVAAGACYHAAQMAENVNAHTAAEALTLAGWIAENAASLEPDDVDVDHAADFLRRCVTTLETIAARVDRHRGHVEHQDEHQDERHDYEPQPWEPDGDPHP